MTGHFVQEMGFSIIVFISNSMYKLIVQHAIRKGIFFYYIISNSTHTCVF